MPSTYTLNNGIELIATGEQSGTWGDTTNTNFNLVDQSLDGQATKTLSTTGTTGSPNTIAITDGTTSEGRNRLLVFDDSGDLGGTAYVQLTPSDSEKIMYVQNTLSGGQSIIFFQGSYNSSNDFELSNGKVAVIRFDGAGSGAVVSDVFQDLQVTGLTSPSVSITGGSITGITDLAVADGGTGASTAAGARTNIGLGTVATQNANNVSITGGTITGITPLAIADGGTGASTASGARTNFGLGSAAQQDTSYFALAAHSHAISDVTGLQTALDGKSDTGHSHAISDVTGLQTALDGKSDTGHTHTLSDVSDSGEMAALDKASQAEAEAGTIDTVGMTPLRTKQAIDALAGGGGFKSIQAFTSSGTWTRPSGITKVVVIVTGGGGGGYPNGPTSGAAGGTAIKTLDVSGISSATITIGSGTASTNISYSNGGNSSWSDGTNTITGGGGEHGGSSGDAGTASGGDLNISGGRGYSGSDYNSGGSSYWGSVPAKGAGGLVNGAGQNGVVLVMEYE